MCFTLHDYELYRKGPQGGLSTEGECSSMAEYAPATFEHGRQRSVIGTIRGTIPEEVSFEEFVEHHLHEFDAL